MQNIDREMQLCDIVINGRETSIVADLSRSCVLCRRRKKLHKLISLFIFRINLLYDFLEVVKSIIREVVVVVVSSSSSSSSNE